MRDAFPGSASERLSWAHRAQNGLFLFLIVEEVSHFFLPSFFLRNNEKLTKLQAGFQLASLLELGCEQYIHFINTSIEFKN